ncbi:hypothetical protein Mapa_005789 [Marchantia paleacea]|nr:hypothetical protein Mapa_005789 [Marchantia paleacea]
MTEAECQAVSMSSGFTFQSGRLYVKHYARNPYAGNDEEDWLFQDTGMVNLPPASIPSVPGRSSAQDSEQGASTAAERSRSSGSPREMSILDEDDQILEIKSAKFYRWSLLRDLFFLLGCIATGGIAIIVSSTWPRVYAKARYVEVTQCDEAAERVLVESMDGTLTLAHIQWIFTEDDESFWRSAGRARFSSDESITNRPRMFIWREERFWYNNQTGSWTRRGFNTDVTYAELHSVASNCALKEIGHDPEENKKSDSRERRSLVYGPNQLSVNVPGFWQLLLLEIFRPFFLFQKLAASECELKRLTLVADEAAELRLRPVLVSSSQLLPGDIVQVEAGMIFPCDLVLLVGQCVVNESMLTGESAPVPKTPLPLGHAAFGQVFRTQSERDGRYKLLSGTKAVQIRGSSNPHASFSTFEMEGDPPASIWQFVSPRSTNLDPLAIKEEATPVAAMVISTAYGTAKGQLVRAILFPKPSKYDFERKLYYFVANLGVYLILVCVVTIFWQAGRETKIDIFKNCINLITIAVPPALPLALSIGLSVSFTRLQTKGIYCINPNRIINAGRVNTLCFDKTGTLTEDGLSLKGVIPVNCSGTQSVARCGTMEEDLQALYRQGNQAMLSAQGDTSDGKTALSSLGLFYTLAACHSISLLDETAAEADWKNSEGSTDELGDKSQGWKKWLCMGRRKPGSGISYSKQRPLRKEEVELKSTNHFIGDPLEIQMFSKTGYLQEVCSAESLPQDFTCQLQELTLSGYRVLACAYRLLESVTLQQVLVANRSQMETSLTFCGFMAMENKLKAETSGVLLQLAKAGLREVMVTGDNPLTAISVSRQCGPFFLRSSCRTFLIDRAADSHSVSCKSGCVLKDVDSERESDLDTLFPSYLEVGEVAVSPGREVSTASSIICVVSTRQV